GTPPARDTPGGPYRARDRGAHPRRPWTVQPGDRGGAHHLDGDGEDPHRQSVGEAPRPGPGPVGHRRLRIRARHPGAGRQSPRIGHSTRPDLRRVASSRPSDAAGPENKTAGHRDGRRFGDSGGAGNRTRVLRRFARASPSAARCASTRPHRSRERVGVTGPVAVNLAYGPRDQVRQASLLADAGYRVEGAPGPTDPLPASGGESEVSALSVGTYFFPTTINETTSASSARFPCLNVRSRNRVTPSYGVRPSSQPNAIGCLVIPEPGIRPVIRAPLVTDKASRQSYTRTGCWRQADRAAAPVGGTGSPGSHPAPAA